MLDDLEVFIVCHDQNIIFGFENTKKFLNLPLYRYLFVGSGKTDLIKNNEKVVICRDLVDNLEQYQNLVSFTSWYALVKNDIIRTKYVSILEYDIELSNDFYQKNLDCLRRNPDSFIGYVVYRLRSPLFLNATPWFPSSVEQTYGFNVRKLISEYIEKTNRDSWCSTSNCSLSIDNLKLFVDWFIPLTSLFRHDKLGAHCHERCIKTYAMISNRKTFYIPGVLIHLQKKSHKIEALI
jgi:hypothetical protein